MIGMNQHENSARTSRRHMGATPIPEMISLIQNGVKKVMSAIFSGR
ncbi:hypothetical protein [Raoultella sp. BIGb0138]|nr:hypothetical protein [Raoultella sp. BIGb0138]